MNIRTSSTAPAPIYPGDPPRRSRLMLLVVAMAVLAIVAAAVVIVNRTGDDAGDVTAARSEGASATTAVPTPTTAADPQAATRKAIDDAYRQSFDAFVAIASDPKGSPDDPRLSRHKIGNALLASQITIQSLRNAGHVYVGRAELHPTVVELTADTAVVADCSLDQFATVEVATGRVVEPAGPATASAATATYRLINGVWMQNSFKDEKRSCVPPAS
ncbi:MAG: hypothetical protein LC808_30735 [Actinobacteria bacterium]|nr:hypothetical protein [Actinomycetota bacterium]